MHQCMLVMKQYISTIQTILSYHRILYPHTVMILVGGSVFKCIWACTHKCVRGTYMLFDEINKVYGSELLLSSSYFKISSFKSESTLLLCIVFLCVKLSNKSLIVDIIPVGPTSKILSSSLRVTHS